MATQKQKVRLEREPMERGNRPGRRPKKGGRVGMYLIVAGVVVMVAAAAVAVLRNEPTTDAATDAVLAPRSEPRQTGTGEATDPPTTKEGEPNFHWPPKGALPALPESGKHGELIMSETNTGNGPNPQYFLRVFADGRVFWQRWYVGGPYLSGGGDEGAWEVRRLTAMGIDLVRRGVTAHMAAKDPGCCSAATWEWLRRHPFRDPFGLPEGAWKDPGPHVYRPARYGFCPSGSSDDTWLGPRVRMILRGSEGGYHGRCVVVTAEDALRLVEILPDRTLSWGGWSRLLLVPLLPDATLPTRFK